MMFLFNSCLSLDSSVHRAAKEGGIDQSSHVCRPVNGEKLLSPMRPKILWTKIPDELKSGIVSLHTSILQTQPWSI